MEFFDKIRVMFGGRPKRFEETERPPIRIENPRQRARDSDRGGLPRFRTSATPRNETGRGQGIRQHIREAFVPSQPVASRAMFAGRLQLLQHLIEAVEDHRAHVVLYGERGIGKTSLLRVFAEAAQEADYLVLHENCGSASRFDEFFRGLCEQVPLLFYGALPPVATQAREGDSLADVLPPGPVGASHIARILADVTGTRLIIILDEFDRAESDDFQREVAELIKNLSDASARVQLVIGGVADNLQDLLGHSPSIRRNIIGISVERMTDDEVEQIIAIGERHAQLTFDAEARAAIVSSAQGFPYLTRLLCHHASLAAVEEGKKSVGVEDVRTALDQSLREMETRLPQPAREAARTWLEADRRAMFEIARAVVKGGGSFDLADVGGGSASAAAKTRSLIENLSKSGGMIMPAAGGPDQYKLVEEGLASYLLLATSPEAATAEGAA